MPLPYDDQDFINAHTARRGIERFEDFRMRTLVTTEAVMSPLALALIAGLILRVTGVVDLFSELEDWYWAACACWFAGGVALQNYNGLILREGYDLYLWRFDEKTLREVANDTGAWVGRNFGDSETIRRHIRDRFDRASAQANEPGSATRVVTLPTLERGRVEFKLAEGRTVTIQEIHVELTTLGVLEGRFELIREHVLAGLPERVKKVFPGHRAFSGSFDAPQHQLPTYVVSVSLISHEPVEGGEFSSVVYSWLTEELPHDMVGHIQHQVRSIPWKSIARDGYF